MEDTPRTYQVRRASKWCSAYPDPREDPTNRTSTSVLWCRVSNSKVDLLLRVSTSIWILQLVGSKADLLVGSCFWGLALREAALLTTVEPSGRGDCPKGPPWRLDLLPEGYREGPRTPQRGLCVSIVPFMEPGFILPRPFWRIQKVVPACS